MELAEIKQKYRVACDTEATIPLFSQDWWLDAVCGKDGWQVVGVDSPAGLVAALPYVLGRKFGMTVSFQPPLTQTLGPWIRPSVAKRAKLLAREKELLGELLTQLPKVAHFSQNWHYSCRNWLPFYWHGYRQTTRYTYLLPDISDLEALWQGFDQGIRTDIRKAEGRNALTVRGDLCLDDFLPLHEMVFHRQGMQLPYSRALLERLDDACVARGRRLLLIAEDSQGRRHAGVYVVYDERSAYYLMGGGNPELRNSGATSLCLWEAIKQVSSVTSRFDFEGSMIEGVEKFFRGFGAEQVPYSRVWLTRSRLWRTLEYLRDLRREAA